MLNSNPIITQQGFFSVSTCDGSLKHLILQTTGLWQRAAPAG